MSDIELTDDQWDALARKRQSHFDGSALPPGSHAEYIAALDAVLALRPERVRPWAPGDLVDYANADYDLVVISPDLPEGTEGNQGIVCATTDVGFVSRWNLDNDDDLTRIAEPNAQKRYGWYHRWVAAGRPGATPSGEFCTLHEDFVSSCPDDCKGLAIELAAPAGTPSGRWWCTAHESGNGHDGAATTESLSRLCWLWQTDTAVPCRWVELLVPATTEPEPDEPEMRPQWGDENMTEPWVPVDPDEPDENVIGLEQYAANVRRWEREDAEPSSVPSVEDIAQQVWDAWEWDESDDYTEAFVRIVNPVLDRLTAAAEADNERLRAALAKIGEDRAWLHPAEFARHVLAEGSDRDG